MRIDFRSVDLEGLTSLYNGSVLDRYRIDPTLLWAHTIKSPLFDWGASCIEPGEAFIAVKRSASTLYRGPNKDVAHVTILGYREPTVLLDLLSNVKKCLIDRGISKLVFGTDSGHFFPGCPIDCIQLKDFLSIAGFQDGSLAHDLERDLVDYRLPCSIPSGFEFRKVTVDDLETLETFLKSEFPGRWHFDTFEKVRQEGSPDFIVGLFQGDRCEGFAITQAEGCKSQIGGAVWKEDLGSHWCSLGPIGISKSLRGKGCGTALLGRALEFLRDEGGRRCIIDWTGLVEFYGSHGFEVTRTYQMATLDLEAYRPN